MTKKIYLETLKKCPGSLHFPLLSCSSYDFHKLSLFVVIYKCDPLQINN